MTLAKRLEGDKEARPGDVCSAEGESMYGGLGTKYAPPAQGTARRLV